MSRDTRNIPRLAMAMLIAALAVMAGTAAYLSRGLPEETPEEQRLAAQDFSFMMGSGRIVDGSVVVESYENGHALLSSGPVDIETGNYRFMSVHVDFPDTAEAPTIFWRLGEAPGDLMQIRLQEAGASLIDLASRADWRERVTEIGVLLREDGGKAAGIGPMLLEPDTLALRLRLMWDGWIGFERWTQKSINFLEGGKRDQTVRLPVLILIWLLLTLGLNRFLGQFLGSRGSQKFLVTAAVIFMAGWMVLDLRWTANNIRQSYQTLQTNWSAGESERMGNGLDGGVYSYILQLKADVLPSQPARILILGDAQAVEYFLQRAKYHLLPHSAYATRSIPGKLTTDQVDYVLFFGVPGNIGQISGWNRDWQKALVRVKSGVWGDVYEASP